MTQPSERRLALGVNIDHVATLRQARYAHAPEAPNVEPSVLEAAREAEVAGADSITVHLRQDRRHIQDRDVFALRASIGTALNLEMGDTPEILEVALAAGPDFVCLVPENRREITTEGGLDAAGADASLERTIRSLQESGIRVSLFIDPKPAQIEAASRLGADMIELHTGAFVNAAPEGGETEVHQLREGALLAHGAGLQVNAGHGITLANLPRLLAVPHLAELNVGHHLVARGLMSGLGRAVGEMLDLVSSYSPEAADW